MGPWARQFFLDMLVNIVYLITGYPRYELTPPCGMFGLSAVKLTYLVLGFGQQLLRIPEPGNLGMPEPCIKNPMY